MPAQRRRPGVPATPGGPPPLARLRRIQGQVGGIIRMVESDRQCREVVQQISAAGRALDQTGLKSSPWELRHCLQDEQAAEQAGYSQAELEDVFAVLMCPRCLADRARGRGPYPS